MNDDQLRSALDDLVLDLPSDGALPPPTARRVARRRGLKLAAGGAGGAGVLALAVTLALTLTGGPAPDRLITPAQTSTPTALPSPSVGPPSAEPEPVQPTATVPQTTAPGGPAEPSATQAPVTPRVVLRPDGLGFAVGSSSSSLSFGADASTVRSAVDRALGAGGEMATPDCGEGSSTVQHEGLFLLLQDDAFVGWVTGSPGLTTGDGIGVGSTLTELRASFAVVELSEGTVGVEWTTGDGGIAGFLDGTQDSSVVTNVAAGVRCIAR